MILEPIFSINNSKIKHIIKLKLSKNRKKFEEFIIETNDLINEAYSFKQLKAVFCTQDWFEKQITDKQDFLDNIEVIFTDKKIIKKLSELSTPQDEAIGLCSFSSRPLDYNENCVLLDKIQDPGNLGTIIRTACAFGFKNIILSPDTVDLYNDKVIRTAKGYLFGVNTSVLELEHAIQKLKDNNFVIIGTFLPSKLETQIPEFPYGKKMSSKKVLLLGNEGNGINPQYDKLIDYNYCIKTSSAVDSLNVAIAGGIIMNDLK